MSELLVLAVDDLAGSFIETAFSAEQVARAAAEDLRSTLIQPGVCAFLGGASEQAMGVELVR